MVSVAEHDTIMIERATVIHGRDGGHCITLPCCGETIFVPARRDRIAVCRSCHRDLTDVQDVGSADPPVCVWCYTA